MMADAGQEFTEPLEDLANGPDTEEGPPEELLAELPDEFRGEDAVDGDVLNADGLEAGEEPEEDSDPEEEEELEAQEPKGSRYQKRVQKLANERKQLQAQLQQQQAQMQQQLYYVQQQAQAQAQAAKQQAEQQVQLYQKQLEMLQSKQAQEEEKNLSPMEQYERKILRQAEERARQGYQSEVAKLQEKLEAQERAQREAYEAQQREARYNYYSNKAAEIRQSQLLNDMEEADVQALGNATDEMLLAFSAAYGMEPDQAAPHFQRFLNRYVQADLKRRTKKGAAKVKASQKVPGSAAPGRSPTTKKGWPTQQQLQAAGYNTPFDWVAAGEPPLR